MRKINIWIEFSIRVFSKMNKSFVSILLLSVLFVIHVLNKTAAVDVIHNNLWSINYLNTVLGSESIQYEFNIPPPNHQRAAFWLSQKANSEGDYDKARMIIESTGNVDESLTRSTLGKILINQGDVLGGVKLLVEVEDLVTLHRIASLAKENGRLDDSLAIYHELSTFHKKEGQVQFEIAQILSSQGKYSEANDWYRSALDKEAHKNWYIQWAKNAEKTRNLVLVAKIYEDMIEHFPEFFPAYLDLAIVYKDMDKPIDAIRIVDRLMTFKLTKVAHYIRSAKIYEWAGDQKMAIKTYKLALAIDPNNKVAQRGINRLNK